MDHINMHSIMKTGSSFEVQQKRFPASVFSKKTWMQKLSEVNYKWSQDNKYYSPFQKLCTVIIFGEIVSTITRILGIHIPIAYAMKQIYAFVTEDMFDNDLNSEAEKPTLYILHTKKRVEFLDRTKLEQLKEKINLKSSSF